MSKKNFSKNINPIAALGKSSKKEKKTTVKDYEDFINDKIQKSMEPQLEEEQPARKRLRKSKKQQNDDDQLFLPDKKQQDSECQQQKQDEHQDQDQDIQYQKFGMVDSKQIQQMKDQKKKKKGGKGGRKAKKGQQQLDKFVQKNVKQDNTKKNNGQKPKITTKLSLNTMFGGGQNNFKKQQIKQQPKQQPRKQLKSQKMDQQNNNSQSQSQDSLVAYQKRQMAMQQLMGGISYQQGMKIAMKQSLNEMKNSKKKSQNIPSVKKQETVPIQNYQYSFFNKNVPKTQKQQKKKKQQIKPIVKEETKNENRKRQKSEGKKKQKQQKQQKSGPLKGLHIVLTGQFEPYSKNKIIELIQQLGGQNPKSITKKTTHLLQGCYVVNTYGRKTDQDVRTTGKSRQAAQKGVTIIQFQKLDDFFLQKAGKTLQQLMQKDKPPPKKQNLIQRYIQIDKKMPSASKTVVTQLQNMEMDIEPNHNEIKNNTQIDIQNPRQKSTNSNIQWTQKYAPRSSQQIIGQQSQIKNLKYWLSVWQDIHIKGNKRDVKPSFNSFMPSGTINSNAALLSGDAGLGKTTTARLVAAQFGYSIVQYNASDARNKKSVQLISQGKNNMSFVNKNIQKTLIIMDEVDGMSSGDRGGISAIIDMIKKTKIPIICICNDRQATKIKSLAGHCYDIKFHKPDRRMVVKRLEKIIQLQGGSSSTRALESIVELLQNDIRQILTYLQVLFRGGNTKIDADLIQKRCSNTKDSSLMVNFFEATKKLMCRTIFKDMSISQRVDLTFVDSDMVPLVVQQNYLSSNNKKKLNKQQMRSLVKATQGFVMGDLVDRTIMRNQDYCLMPNKMFLNCVYPCEMICQNIGFPKFTQWLGKFSSQRKNKRLIKQLKYTLACVSNVTSSSIKHNYAPTIYQRICQQLNLNQPNFQSIVKFMIHYGITPNILTQHLSVLQYGSRIKLFTNILTAKKTKLTKTYNKLCQATKFKKQKVKVVVEHAKYDPVLGEMEEENQEEDQDQGQDDKQNQADDILEKKTKKAKNKK